MKILILLAALVWGDDEKKDVKLQGFDVLTTQGQSVELRAKLEKRGVLGVNPNLHKQELVFSHQGKEIGRAITADEGIAWLSWTPPKDLNPAEQELEFQVSFVATEKYEAASTVVRVFIRDPKKPALVIDLDGTICASKEIDVGLKPPSELKCMDGSVQALQELAKTYDLIYLTARDEGLINRSREWLDHNKYPHGPLLTRDLKLWNLSAQRHKAKRLAELKKQFNLVAGVGDREDDAEAYLENGLAAYLVGDTDRIPQGAKKTSGWAEVTQLLKKP